LSLVERGGIGDALAALCTRKGIDEEVRRADEPLLHGRRGLDGEQFVHQGVIKTMAKLGQRFGQHKMLLRAVPLDHLDATGVHDRKVGAQAVTDVFVRGVHLAHFGTIVIEDLHVKGITRNRHLARAISDMGFGMFCRMLAYKAEAAGVQLVVADRWLRRASYVRAVAWWWRPCRSLSACFSVVLVDTRQTVISTLR